MRNRAGSSPSKGWPDAILSFRPQTPSEWKLERLCWITQVRMHLEEQHPQMHWISERTIRSQQGPARLGERQPHPPDGILVLPGPDGALQSMDSEVQISKPREARVRRVMRAQSHKQGHNYPLRYSVNRRSRSIVRSTYKKTRQEGITLRTSIEIIDLTTWKSLVG